MVASPKKLLNPSSENRIAAHTVIRSYWIRAEGYKMLRLLSIASILLVFSACEPPGAPPPPQIEPKQQFQIVDLAVGTGDVIAAGKTAVVHYTGWLFDKSALESKGVKFDSSRDRGEPFRFPLGGGRVIKGWDEGVVGMQVGGQRKLIIPPDMGYAARGAGKLIPPNATLLFDVELLAIE
jgi:FKBP-type peptidyl-prolyl cis-trans isomerase FkpA